MCVTAAFTRPDSYIRIVEHFTAPQQGSIFDFYHIELAEMAFILVVSRTGNHPNQTREPRTVLIRQSGCNKKWPQL
jgi:hypothetical protein